MRILSITAQKPYPSTRYCDMSPEMTEKFSAAWIRAIRAAVDNFNPDLILCHHLYLLTALVRKAEWQKRAVPALSLRERSRRKRVL